MMKLTFIFVVFPSEVRNKSYDHLKFITIKS